MNTIMNGIVCLAELFIAYTYISDMYERKYTPSKTVAIGFPLFFISFLVNELWKIPNLNLIVFTALTACFIILCYRVSFIKGIANSILFTIIMATTELVCFYLIAALFEKGTFYVYRENAFVYMLCSISSKVLFLLVCKLFSRFRIKNEAKIYRFPLVYVVYTITGFILIDVLILINAQYEYSMVIRYLLVVSSALLLFSMIFLFISYEKTARKNAELMELKAESQQQRLDEKHYQLLMVQNENIHTFAHDIKHQLSTLMNITDNDEVKNYISSIYDDLEKYSVVGKTDNKILDIILSEYQSICYSKGIELEVDIKTANLSFIEPSKLVALLTNILDNAIESAENCDEKNVFLSINRAENFDVLICENSCCISPKITDDYVKTTKQNKEFHGFGTKSIAKITKQYNGNIKYEFDKTQNQFTVNIVFPRQ